MISSLPPPPSALPHPWSPSFFSSPPASLHPSLAANLSHTPSTNQWRLDGLLQGTVLCAAHGQNRERDSHTQARTFFFPPFTPAFIYLHRSPAAAPFILAFSSSSVPLHLLPCSGSSIHPSQPTWMPTSFFLSCLSYSIPRTSQSRVTLIPRLLCY